MGLLLKLNFSQEKLSLYSLMLVLDTMGTSSPEMVPAVGAKSSHSAHCHFALRELTYTHTHTHTDGARLAVTYYYESINGCTTPFRTTGKLS